MLTQARLKELLSYDPETGLFTRLVSSGTAKVGDIAGSLHNAGYVVIRVDGGVYLAHRLAWIYMIGAWPCYQIDHIDGNRTNNRFVNLRDTPHEVNQQNRKGPQRNNTSGKLGICKTPSGKYSATITTNGKNRHLGTFETEAKAYDARLMAVRQHYPGNTL